MKPLLDEMYARLKEYLEMLDYEVVTARELGFKDVKEWDVVEYAGNQVCLLLLRPEAFQVGGTSQVLGAFCSLT